MKFWLWEMFGVALVMGVVVGIISWVCDDCALLAPDEYGRVYYEED